MQGIEDLADVSSLGLNELSEPASLIFIAHATQLTQCLLNEFTWNLFRRLQRKGERKIQGKLFDYAYSHYVIKQ